MSRILAAFFLAIGLIAVSSAINRTARALGRYNVGYCVPEMMPDGRPGLMIYDSLAEATYCVALPHITADREIPSITPEEKAES